MGSVTATVTPRPLGLGRVILLVAVSLLLHALVLSAIRNRLAVSVAEVEPAPRTIDAALIVEAPPAPPPVRRAVPRPRPRPAPPKPAPVQEPVAVSEPVPAVPPTVQPIDDSDRPGPGDGDTTAAAEPEPPPVAPAPDPSLVQAAPEQRAEPAGPDLAAEMTELGGALESLPAAGTYVYKLRDSRYSALSGTTTIDWRVDAASKRYETRLRMTVFGIPLADITSAGAIRRFGLAPERYVQKTGTRAPQAANLDWEQRIVTFSSRTFQRPAHEGMQDRLSFQFQLMALGQNLPAAFKPGATISMEVAGPGDVESYHFLVVGTETVETEAGPIEAIKLDRPRVDAGDTRIEVWLAPERRYLPIRLRFTDRRDNVTESLLESVREGG